jgi:hypothetical protein
LGMCGGRTDPGLRLTASFAGPVGVRCGDGTEAGRQACASARAGCCTTPTLHDAGAAGYRLTGSSVAAHLGVLILQREEERRSCGARSPT